MDNRHVERKFTRVLGRMGLAAQLREDISQAVKASASQARSHLPDPIDFEDYVTRNKVLINNDSLRELLVYPSDDISSSVMDQEIRTLHSVSTLLLKEHTSNPLVKQCLRNYSQSLTTLTFKYLLYSGSYIHLPRLPKIEDLKEQVYEIDTDIEQRDLALLSNGENILKKGYLLKAPESSNEKIFANFSAKTFKRRFACLRQEVDGTFSLEFYKDERRNESKGVLVMEFCTQVNRNPRRGRCCFELTFSEGGRSVDLSAESEADLEDWIDKVTRVIHADKPQDDIRSEKGTPSSNNYGTLRSLEHSLNPQLIKYAHESDFSIGQARKEKRHEIFACYPDLPKHDNDGSSVEFIDNSSIVPYEEKFGRRFRVTCKGIRFKLQAPIDSQDGPLAQIEPYFTTIALYDRAKGRKISEDFRFDLNNSFAKNLLPKISKSDDEMKDQIGVSALSLAGVPEEWLASPKQAVMSVKNPSPDIYLVMKIEKVLQGSITQTAEPYMKIGDSKSVQKLQRNIKTCCQRLGEFRMPFGWCARPIFRMNGEVDCSGEFSPIYKYEEKKISETEFLKLLNESNKLEKAGKLTVIPGSVDVEIRSIQVPPPNSVTCALEPVKPFPNPPTHEPSVEIQEFQGSTVSFLNPHTKYCNHLYVYPRCLNYEKQNSFSRARNIVCKVELRDSDDEDSAPLQVVYAPPGHPGLFTDYAYTSVLHHNTYPEWNDEIKMSLPPDLTSSHHLLFTFLHVSIEGTKAGKKEDPIEVVGYAWFPLFQKGRIFVDDQMLPVAAHLPAKYLTIEPLGLGKGFSGPDIRWVDSQKNMFKVQMKMVSTVLSSDQHLANYFHSSSSLIPIDNDSNSSYVSLPKYVIHNEVEVVKNLKALLALEIQTIIRFLPVLLNQLFLVLLSGGEDVPVNVARVLVHITHEIHQAGREEVLFSYIKFVQNITTQGTKTVHGELCKSFTVLLFSSLDPVTSLKVLRHLEIFFSFIIRSMTIHLVTSTRIKMQRNERFSEDFHLSMKNLVELVTSNVIQKYKEMPVEARAANKALAYLLKQCLSMMDRGFVFGLIKFYLASFNPGDPIVLHSFKFTLLRIVCSHEHFITLNLPLFATITPAQIKQEKLRQGYDEFNLSGDFIAHHFLVGALLSELRSALGEVTEVQRISIKVLRDILAKHAFDDRYLHGAVQGRIAMLYFPVVSILMENVSRLSWPSKNKAGILGSSLKNGGSSRMSQRSRASRASGSIEMSFTSTPTPSLRSSIRTDAGRGDASYLSIIAGPGVHGSVNDQLLSPSPLVSGKSCTSIESDDRTSINTDLTEEDDKFDDSTSTIATKTHSRNISLPFTGECGPVRYDKLSPSEVKNLLLCFLHVLKHVPELHLASWWMTLSKEYLKSFFSLLILSLHYFKYIGKRQIVRQQTPKKAFTLPTKLQSPFHHNRASIQVDTCSVSSHDGEGWVRALQEANLATEVGLIILDALCNFTIHCGELLKGKDCEDVLHQVFDLHMLFLQLGQSESLMKHVFAALRAFINNFPSTLFEGDPAVCGSLCFEVLKYCNSKLTNLRHEACAVLYLLMRSNYEFTGRNGINRVHLQIIISVSELLGEVIGLNNARFQESMALINSYASSDKAMTNSGFVSEVRDLTKRIRTVLVATAQMREHERDPEMLCDLQYSLAASYAATPELRTTWLQAMVKHHVKNGDFSEAALCLLHICALIAEYLRFHGDYPEGCKVFAIISQNISEDESNLRLDAACSLDNQGKTKGVVDTVFTVDTLIEQLEVSADMVERAERYELLGNLYRILIPIYESRRNYSALISCYSHLLRAYTQVVEVNSSLRRLLGRYYRVAFYGPSFFEEEAGKAYVYKEPKVTSLAEISERLFHQYCEKFGKETVKMIMDSNFVDADKLDSRYAYVQVTHVEPFFNEEERPMRQTEFEKNNNIKHFVFETPFTLDGRAHGKLEDQWKRRVLVTTAYTFPYVKKRILIVDSEVQEMSPIEVAIDEMEGRVKELHEIVNNPTDVKKLQLKLQGSISVQVNAGPLAYASAFLTESHAHSYPPDQVNKLKEVYRQFVMISKQALELNGRLVNSDQYEYQMSLEANFNELHNSLTRIFNEPLIVPLQVDVGSNRSSQHYLSIISSPRGSSAV